METQTRLRPLNLQPLWTQHESLGRYPRAGPQSARRSLYSPSVRSPTMPSALYPRSPGYDSMRRQERAMVESFDPRGRPVLYEPREHRSGRSLSPIVEQGWDRDRRRSSYALPRAPAPTPVTPHSPMQQTQTLASETRSILLSGLGGQPPAVSSNMASRRQSLPASFPAQRRGSDIDRQELQAWGHVFFGNGSEANCFVSAVALRRGSESSAGEEAASSPTTKTAEQNGRVTIRARVRPCALGKKPFILKREFDMDELRATVVEPVSSPAPGEPRRLSHEVDRPRPNAQDRRRSSAASGSDAEGPSRSSLSRNTVPIHLRYARAYLPVLAALIYSGHIKPRDIIDLPVPFPEVWAQTVAYVYTGQGDLTEPMKQNILYLGGKT
ncbi:hypothetical protein B0T18DRAFT_437951 [Schizothecium vesticola]|uniref:Uncharacterized protein n=1 Tax=Schizothecium vesticola TaxID=314040 RepID=A0AA40K4N5_9PEZI|nr:hypothetical protein B0T18DRAFT_437951 [Schizothecium vesticola]